MWGGFLAYKLFTNGENDSAKKFKEGPETAAVIQPGLQKLAQRSNLGAQVNHV